MDMKLMTTSKSIPLKRWQILASEQGNTEQRKRYLQNCPAFEFEVRRLIKYHKLEIKKAKALLSEVPKSQHWHFSYRLAKRSVKENQFYVHLLHKVLPCRKSLLKRIIEFVWRCLIGEVGYGS